MTTQFVTVEDVSPTTLTYVPRVSPAPLTVSVPGRDPKLGSLEVLITNQTQNPVPVVSIKFAINVGTPGAGGTPLSPSTTGLELFVSDETSWALSGPSTNPPVVNGIVDVVLQKKTGASVSLAAGASVVVQIYGFATVPTPGTTTVTVKETVVGADPQFTSFGITTFPDGFYFNGLIATTAAGAVAQVPHGTPVTLKWNSSVADTVNVAIYYSTAAGGQQGPVPPCVLGQWCSPPLTDDAMFVVTVTAQGVGNQTLTAALATAVSVQNPDVVAKSAAVSGDVAIRGGASVGGSLAAQAITATGVTVNGAITASGGATIAGPLAAGATTVTGAIGATGGVTAGGPVVSSSGVSSLANLAVGEKITGQYLYLTWTPGFQTGAPGLWVKSNTWGPTGRFENSGGGPAVFGTSSGPNPAGQFLATSVPSTGSPSALSALVPNGSNGIGLQTNGRIVTSSTQPLLTHVETSNGHRVAAPPLSLEPEIHISGRAQLAGGRAVVELGADAADLIHHSEDRAYRVLITPTARCNGLAVTSKGPGSFVVEELIDGTSDATFDWLVVAHMPESLSSPAPAVLPEALDPMPRPPAPPDGGATAAAQRPG